MGKVKVPTQKVQVSKELYEALKKTEEFGTIIGVAESVADGYIYESEDFKIFNTLTHEELMTIHENGYELKTIEENSIIINVLELLQKQTTKGYAKYGKTVEAADLTTEQWIQHAQEEAIDFVVYLECLKTRLKNEYRD